MFTEFTCIYPWLQRSPVPRHQYLQEKQEQDGSCNVCVIVAWLITSVLIYVCCSIHEESKNSYFLLNEMLVHYRVITSINFADTQSTWVKRDAARVKSLAQNRNTVLTLTTVRARTQLAKTTAWHGYHIATMLLTKKIIVQQKIRVLRNVTSVNEYYMQVTQVILHAWSDQVNLLCDLIP